MCIRDRGCGGELQEWLDGINEMFTEAGILKNGAKFQDISAFEYDGLTCLLYPFEDVDLEIGKLAMWRLQTHENFGGTWLSDFVPNRLEMCIRDRIRTGWGLSRLPLLCSTQHRSEPLPGCWQSISFPCMTCALPTA